MYAWTDFFTDPLLRAPVLGSLFMSITASLVGVISLIRKRSLVGETLSHASYPGIVGGAWVFGLFFASYPESFPSFLLVGAFICSFLGLVFLRFLQARLRVKSDAALCFVLSSFFAIGVLLSSRMQYTHGVWYRQVQSFLYGQPATMTDSHVFSYGLICLLVIVFLSLAYRSIQLVNFDEAFASSMGVSVKWAETLFFFLLVLAVTVAIRGIGVVLVSGMLIVPALAARQLTNHLAKMFVIAAILGGSSAFLGNYISAQLPFWSQGASVKAFPIGPLIVLSSSLFCFLSLFFAPKKGLWVRLRRRRKFAKKCQEENLLKMLCKKEGKRSCKELSKLSNLSCIRTYCLLVKLSFQGWVLHEKEGYFLSKEGKEKAARIIRIHRLWEAYLVHLGQGKEKTHASAEEMEHVITPELEEKLLAYLGYPHSKKESL